MTDHTTEARGLMEGEGSYNKYAKLPAGGAALAMPHLEQAAAQVAIDSGNRPFLIADYGSSQGKNSQAPMQLAIRTLRHRLGPDRSIFVFHVDQPQNDFNSLFGVLASDPDRYTASAPNVFPAAIGRSFYEQVLPANSVDLGWSSYAAVWLSSVPCLIPNGFFIPSASGSIRAQFDRQAALDWELFLSLRARELRPGGRLVVVLPALPDEGPAGFEHIMASANSVLAQMVPDGAITSEERTRMIVPSILRRNRDLLAPFERDGQFHHLTVEKCEIAPLSDAAWLDYERDHNLESFVTKHLMFFRAVFVSTLASYLTHAHDPRAVRAFTDQFCLGLKHRLAVEPTPMHSFAHTIVLAKSQSSASAHT